MSDTILGGFPKKEDEKFMDTLRQIANIMDKACFDFGSIFVGEDPVVPGGVRDFKDALRRAVAFKKALSESKGEVLRWLANIEATLVWN